MRTLPKFLTTACLLFALGMFLSAAAEDEKPNTAEKSVQISKERLWGVWQGYDTNNGVAFRVEFTNHLDRVTVKMSGADKGKTIESQVTQEAPDKPFKIGSYGEVVPLPEDRLHITIDAGLVLPWVPCKAILERVKAASSSK